MLAVAEQQRVRRRQLARSPAAPSAAPARSRARGSDRARPGRASRGMSRVLEQRVHLRRPREDAVAQVVQQRLLADPVAREQQLLAALVPQREREHAVQVAHAVGAVLLVEVHDHLGVALRGELVAAAAQLLPQLAVVVDLAVHHDDDGAILVEDRLVAGAEVDHAQALDSDAGATVDDGARASPGRDARAPRTSAPAAQVRPPRPGGGPVRRFRTFLSGTSERIHFSRDGDTLAASGPHSCVAVDGGPSRHAPMSARRYVSMIARPSRSVTYATVAS